MQIPRCSCFRTRRQARGGGEGEALPKTQYLELQWEIRPLPPVGDVDKLANNIYQAMTGRPVSSLEGTGWKTLAFKARRCLHALHELDSDHFWEAYDDKVKNPQLPQVFVGAILLHWNSELEISGYTSLGGIQGAVWFLKVRDTSVLFALPAALQSSVFHRST